VLEAGTVLNDRYEIIEKIGAGGMSIVYKAKCRKLLRYVAIKVLRDEFAKDKDFLESFKAEALSAASLSHPNIVGIYDVGNDIGCHYIVMEYVEGKTLKELIQKHAPYNTQGVLEFGISLLSAIRHAHMKKIIHRDIKPQNILVTPDNILKVTDFGIARAVDSSTLVSTGTAIGSVHYFSPEQARGKYVDETSDLYSCGIVLFELATGRLPFEAESHVSVALKHINDEIPRPSSINSNIAPTLEKIILKATQKRPEMRYSSAQNMLQDLMRLSSNPSYQIADTLTDVNQQTILMTAKETEFIRQNSKGDRELQIPSWHATNPRTHYNEVPYVPSEEPELESSEEDEDDEASRGYNIMVTVAGVLAAAVLIGIITFFSLPLFGKIGKPKVVVVPNLITTQIDKATADLKVLGLEIKILDEEETEGIPTGEIIKQAPVRDQIVPVGTIIEVIISKEIEVVDIVEEESIVPDIIGMDFPDAQSDLFDLDLVLQVTDRQFDDVVESGMIISQNPMSGNTLSKGDVVSVIVSKGKEVKTIPVPNLLDIDEGTAVSMLENLGIKVGGTTYEESDTVDKGKVIRQGVPAGRDIEKSISVSIVVSKGKKEVPVEVAVSKNLSISIPGFLEEKDEYQVFVRLLSDNGDTTTIYQGQVKKEDFPLVVSVKGKGKGTVETYIDNEPTYADPIDFDEVAQ